MKIHPGVLEISRKRGKNSIFRPNSLTLGGSHPKSNQLIVTSNLTFWPSLMKFHQVILELSRKRKNPDGHPDGQPGNIMPPAPSVRRHKNHEFDRNARILPEFLQQQFLGGGEGGCAPLPPPPPPPPSPMPMYPDQVYQSLFQQTLTVICRVIWQKCSTNTHTQGIYTHLISLITRSLREPGGLCTQSMEVSESCMERVKVLMQTHTYTNTFKHETCIHKLFC